MAKPWWQRIVMSLVLLGCGRSPLPLGEGDYGGPDFDGDDARELDGGRMSDQECREVNFLFVVDNSRSMQLYQSNLLANYDVFIEGVADAVDTIESLHVGVVTAAPYPDNVPGCRGIGGLVTRTGGRFSSERQCGPLSEGNYISERDSLDGNFRCMAQVGIGGSDRDTPVAAALAAVSPPLTDEGQCNEGFFTPGALLVLVIISDTYPNGFGVTDIDPYAAGAGFGESVGGSDDIVVVLISSTEEAECLNPLAPGLHDFATQYEHSFVGAICEEDYSRVFGPAIEVVKAACPQ